MYKQCKFIKDNFFQTTFVEDKTSIKIGAWIKSDIKQKWEMIEIGIQKNILQLIHSWQM